MTDVREVIARALSNEAARGIRRWQEYLPDADRTIAALDAAGKVVVPSEPTKEMLEAGILAAEDCLDHDYDSDADGNRYDYTTLRSDASSVVYRAMIAARPGHLEQHNEE